MSKGMGRLSPGGTGTDASGGCQLKPPPITTEARREKHGEGTERVELSRVPFVRPCLRGELFESERDAVRDRQAEREHVDSSRQRGDVAGRRRLRLGRQEPAR